jgi:cation diffusion facilitator family transporter
VVRKAKALEWVTIAFFASAVTLMYLALGSSQAMKAAWIEDLLAFIPPITFLIANRVRYRRPNEQFPYGYHRAVAIGFLASAFALLILGGYILYDSIIKLISFEHPPIGVVQPLGDPIWLGWLMIGALTYTLVPAVILGRLKQPLASSLHDKILYADAEMNRADWMTAGAAILGVLGIRFGLWWADAVAALAISISIVKDRVKSLGAAVSELMNRRPRTVDDSADDPLQARVETELRRLPWVRDVRVRLREEGHVFYGEAAIVPRTTDHPVDRIEEAAEKAKSLDWRMHDLVVTMVDGLPEFESGPSESASV